MNLGRLRPNVQDPARLASLKGNKDPRNTDDSGYIDYFYLPPDAAVAGTEWVVDFSQVTSLPGVDYQHLLRRKVLQLKDRERVKFKIKLAVFLGRLTDEEHELGLENPWLTLGL